MRTATNLLILLGLVSGAVSGVRSREPRIRVGTYDSRAIAVAYAPSRFNPVGEKMKEYEKAKQAGDGARVAELEAWGEKQQRRLHRQGFARVPVDDLLAPVKDRLAEVAQRRALDLVAWSCDYTGPGVEVVDVTDDLVALFEPSEKTRAIVAEVRRREPLDLDEVEAEHEH